MTPLDRGFLLLTQQLGDPSRKPLTTAQLRRLADRVSAMEREEPDRELCREDLMRIGYSADEARRILTLLSQEEQLDWYLEKAKAAAYDIGVNPNIDPFMTLSFMALPVIPTLRLTTRGVIDVISQQYI